MMPYVFLLANNLHRLSTCMCDSYSFGVPTIFLALGLNDSGRSITYRTIVNNGKRFLTKGALGAVLRVL